MAGPYYISPTGFPAQNGKPVLISREAFEDCCCVTFLQTWSFTDIGFIDGGQDGAYRAYDDPSDVSASPWSILNDGLSLRLDWEDDDNCRNHNPNTQSATATAEIVVPRAMVMTIAWSGMGEVESSRYELMSLSVDGTLIGSAHAPGGSDGCDPMGPVISDPNPPQQVTLQAGTHTLFIDATTNDQNYHYDAWYRFDLTFAEAS